MKTHHILNDFGRVVAFEIELVFFGVRRIAALLRSVPGVEEVRVRGLFQRPADVHIHFSYLGVGFIVLEPYADNSRYWIGPERGIGDSQTDSSVDITNLERPFQEYDPPFIVKLAGALLSLDWRSRKLRA